MSRELSASQLIERSITKKYRKQIWNPFIGAVKRYELIREGDKIAVCISGGKDSMLLAKLMQLLRRITEPASPIRHMTISGELIIKESVRSLK